MRRATGRPPFRRTLYGSTGPARRAGRLAELVRRQSGQSVQGPCGTTRRPVRSGTGRRSDISRLSVAPKHTPAQERKDLPDYVARRAAVLNEIERARTLWG